MLNIEYWMLIAFITPWPPTDVSIPINSCWNGSRAPPNNLNARLAWKRMFWFNDTRTSLWTLQLEAIDKKLSAHLEELNKFLLIRMEVKECLNQHHDPFTRHLPVEITSHIFAIYTENFNSDFDFQHPIIEHGGPLLLGAVSKSWRKIAFSTPNLWNTVNILIPSTHHLPTKVELTKQWLHRSRQLPLYLSLIYRISNDRVEPEPDSLIPLFNVLQRVAPRWYKLVLESCTPHFLAR